MIVLCIKFRALTTGIISVARCKTKNCVYGEPGVADAGRGAEDTEQDLCGEGTKSNAG